jgi:uncharacterized RDD family membrane protein YckC
VSLKPPVNSKPLTYASFAARARAFGLDYLLISVYLLCLFGLVRAFKPPVAWFGSPARGQFLGFPVVTLPVTLYFAIAESSRAHASWGKKRLKLRVTDMDGMGLRWPRSLLRTLLKFVPRELAHAAIWRLRFPGRTRTNVWMIVLGLVWTLVFANLISMLVMRKHQTLYDLIAGTVVIDTADSRVTV